MKYYAVKFQQGYLLTFRIGAKPYFTRNPKRAKRFAFYEDAVKMIRNIKRLGYDITGVYIDTLEYEKEDTDA